MDKEMESVSPLNTALKYGSLAGLSGFALFLILWFEGKDPLGNWSAIGWIFPIIFILMAIRQYRDKESGGYITYRRGLGLGMLVTLFSAFVFCVLIYASISFFAQNVIQMQLDTFYAQAEQIRQVWPGLYGSMMDEFEKNKSQITAGTLAIGDFENRLIGGLIISLIGAGVYMRKQPPFDLQEPNVN